MTAQSKPEADAKVISQLDRTNNADSATSAYHKFQEEYNDYAKTHSAPDTATYLKSVTENLVANKTLPDLAVAWGADNRNRIGEGGNPNLFELSMVGNDRNAIDQVMAPVLSSEFSQIAGVGSGDQGRIHDSDWDAWSKQHQTLNVEHNTTSGLLQTTDGKLTSTLFDYIDAAPGGNNDHRIDQDDLHRYEAQYNFDAKNHQLSSHQTPEDLKLVQFLDKNWDDPSVKQLREHTLTGGRGMIGVGPITLDSLKSAGNFSSVDQMINGETVKPETVTPASGKAGTTDSPTKFAEKSLETTTADVLAKNPGILEAVTDSNGNIVKEKVDQLLHSMIPAEKMESNDRSFTDTFKMLNGLENNWGELSKQFSNDGGKSLNLNNITEDGFDGKQQFADRLKRDGDEPIDSAARLELVQFCKTHHSFLADKRGIIHKHAIDQAFADSSQLSDQEKLYVTQLHNSFEYLKADDGTIDINNFS